jgi:hypothetical protein
MLNAVMLSAVMLSAVILCVVAHKKAKVFAPAEAFITFV